MPSARCTQNYNWVIPGKLAIGDWHAGTNDVGKFGGVVVATPRLPLTRAEYNDRDVLGLQIPVHDNEHTNIAQYFAPTNKFIKYVIEKRKQPVLVHCAAGMSRSVTLTAAYLMDRYGLSAPEAIRLVTQARPCQSINRGFQKQLLTY